MVRGARILATLAPFADELAVYPGHAAAPGRRRLRAGVLDPDGDAGAQVPLPRQHARAANAFDHPLSSRFDEQDAFVIFDDVEVPRERVFIDAQPRRSTTR